MQEYQVSYHSDCCVEVKKDFMELQVNRIPYGLMKSKSYSVKIDNKHLVYILSGKDGQNRDCLYVGKSSNGTKNRPTDHEDQGVEWDSCYILQVTGKNSFNGGMAEYLEHCIKGRIDDSNRYRNITKTTTEANANDSEKRRCKVLLPGIYDMMDILGVCLKSDIMLAPEGLKESEPFMSMDTAEYVDYSSMQWGNQIVSWLDTMEDIVKRIEPSASIRLMPSSKYVGYWKKKITVIRCYPKKMGPELQVFFLGKPSMYGDGKVVPRPDTHNDAPLDSMFIIRSYDDLEYFRIFAEKAFKAA